MNRFMSCIPFLTFIGVGLYALHLDHVGIAVCAIIAAFLALQLVANEQR